MTVYGCYVEDISNSDREVLIGDDGCANDIYLMNNPEYPTDLMAGVEAHVFKYADRPQLYFQCQVTILVKEPGQECPRPACAAPPGRGGPRPAGPAPPASAVSFPLQQGQGYLADGSQVYHGPGDPATGFAAHPGRPDPGFHVAGATLQAHPGAAPRGFGAGAASRPRPAPRAQPAPAVRRPTPVARARPQPAARRQPFGSGGRNPFGRRPFDAPAIAIESDFGGFDDLSDLELSRKKRQVEFFDSAAGTMDVRTDLNTLDIDEKVAETP